MIDELENKTGWPNTRHGPGVIDTAWTLALGIYFIYLSVCLRMLYFMLYFLC